MDELISSSSKFLPDDCDGATLASSSKVEVGLQRHRGVDRVVGEVVDSRLRQRLLIDAGAKLG
jgi:hypothetical protein